MSNTKARQLTDLVKHYAEKDDPVANLENVEFSDTVQIARAYLALDARCAAQAHALEAAQSLVRSHHNKELSGWEVALFERRVAAINEILEKQNGGTQ